MEEVPALNESFAAAKIQGTFVLYDLEQNVWRVHDASRARQRFVPASTFKIANSLIGLDCGAVKDVDEVLPYGGQPQPFPAWEHDMGLREAIRLSAVPIYQELARRIGLKRMRAGVQALAYGNQEIGTVVDRFWLDGPLQISAVEQTEFLGRLVQGKLPVKPETLAAVEEITLQEKTPVYELHYKTGWSFDQKEPVGWTVGWVLKDGKYYPFALNLNPIGDEDIPKRVPLVKACLEVFGVLPPAPAKE